jgi:hypothetical protein
MAADCWQLGLLEPGKTEIQSLAIRLLEDGYNSPGALLSRRYERGWPRV